MIEQLSQQLEEITRKCCTEVINLFPDSIKTSFEEKEINLLMLTIHTLGTGLILSTTLSSSLWIIPSGTFVTITSQPFYKYLKEYFINEMGISTQSKIGSFVLPITLGLTQAGSLAALGSFSGAAISLIFFTISIHQAATEALDLKKEQQETKEKEILSRNQELENEVTTLQWKNEFLDTFIETHEDLNQTYKDVVKDVERRTSLPIGRRKVADLTGHSTRTQLLLLKNTYSHNLQSKMLCIKGDPQLFEKFKQHVLDRDRKKLFIEYA